MIKIVTITLALMAGLTATAATARPLGVSIQGRPHAGGTSGDMLLFRSHLTEKRYWLMRAENEQRDLSRQRY